MCLLTTGAFASGVSGMANLHAWSAEVSVSWKYHANLSITLLLLLPPWCTFYTPMPPWLKTLSDGNSPRKVSVWLTLSATFYVSQMLLVGLTRSPNKTVILTHQNYLSPPYFILPLEQCLRFRTSLLCSLQKCQVNENAQNCIIFNG